FPAWPRADRRARLQAALLEWFQTAKRDLPWRRSRDSYGIWISEAMLQQTRVSTVIDYWVAFMAAFPTVEALAEANEQQVLACWSGLGYYSRARSLHSAARSIVDDHAGEFPRERSEALALPGVGEYTAGAVLSIAHGLPEALVDGNVERVLTRVFGLRAAAGSPALRKHTWELARRFLVEDEAGDWNQALMELGALVCTPGEPNCGDCPWARMCVARKRGEAAAWPSPKPRRKAVSLMVTGLWSVDAGKILLFERPSGGPMAGLWELPSKQEATPGARSIWPGEWAKGLAAPDQDPLFATKHAITHHRITMTVFEGSGGRGARTPAGHRWFAWSELEGAGLTGLARKAVAHLQP
ncbi:MAG: A/G-specific adenine glycosylase, partial [Planctomycetes bacterium]|nr:A/G-specific adenine glycosylase [Planctomycetota bacterium]